jgi:hypothetical protein
MTSAGQVYLKRKSIKHTFNSQLAVRNVLIAMAFCLAYLLGKYYRPIHSTSAHSVVNIKDTKHK